MRPVFQYQAVHLVVDERDKMVARNPYGVDQKFYKRDSHKTAGNYPMEDVVAYDHPENEESSQKNLDYVWDQNRH